MKTQPSIRVLGSVALAVVMSVRGAAAQATPPETLTVAAATRMALQANPVLRAARASAEARAQRIGPAGALPDPQLQFGLMNRMASQFGSAADPMTMNQLQLMQMLPWPGKLGGARLAARHDATAASADADEQARMLGAQVRMAYYDVAYADRALEVMQETQQLLRQFLDVSTTMYAVGSAVQQDVLRAQVEVARMTEEITRVGQERLAGAARLNALLGRDAARPIGPLELPEPAGDLPDADSLIARAIAERPAVRAGMERVAAAEATLSAARRELYPDFQVGVAYQQRPQFPTMVSLMVGVNLPIFAGSKQLATRRQMAAMRDMSQADLLNLKNETAARILETRARAVQDRNLVHLYRTSIAPQARAVAQSSLSGYRVGRVTFMQLLDNQMTVNRYETETYRLIADYHQALGELEALVGQPLEGQP
ncbi:MAG TPA: TolC family protein [Gemmatimonadales bacterium]|jgi:outer membrane protein TolC|nr:TolC family protein [Gemmatimonadales bacterium]